MLKKVLKILLLFIGSLIALILAVLGFSYFDIRSRANETYQIKAEPIRVSYDSGAIQRGERLAKIRACTECHGADFGGATLHEDFMIGRLASRNITKGRGGLPADFTESDWVLALKHGLRRDRKPLFLMPSHELSRLSETDMADLIAYCSQLPRVDRESQSTELGPLGYVLSEFKLIPLLPAEFTDHAIPFAKEVMPQVSIEYGKYLSTICINCHGENMKGGESPVPGGKYIADISSTGNPGKWTDEQFVTALHTGKTPEGKELNPGEMPWTITKAYSEEELAAIHLYLLSIK